MEQAIEDLAVELASDAPIELTNQQIEMGVKKEIIYIAGLALHGLSSAVRPPFPSSLHERFLKLQQIWSVYDAENESYHLSPRLVPSNEQQKLIDTHIKIKLREMETKANVMARELMEKEKHSIMPTSRRIKTKSKKKRHPRSKDKSKSYINGVGSKVHSASSDVTESLQDLINKKICVEENSDGGSWLTVKKDRKNGNLLARQQDSDIDCDVERMKDLDVMKTEIPMKQDENEGNFGQKDSNLNEISIKNCKQNEIPMFESKYVGSDNEDEGSDPNFQWKEHIQRLELQLLGKNQQLMEERETHLTSMRQQKERYDDQIQALQMRLYISETKQKNYEDALRQHIETVSLLWKK